MKNLIKSFTRFRMMVQVPILISTVLLTYYSCKAQDVLNRSNESQILFRDGVVVDIAQKTIYIANSESNIEAIEFETGRTQWQSATSGRPLCLIDNKLVVQLDQNEDRATILFGELNTRENGILENEEKIDVPSEVRASIRNSVDGTFNITPYVVNGQFAFDWTYFPPVSGDYNEEEETVRQSGVVLFDGSNYSVADTNSLPGGYNQMSILANKEQQVSQENTLQYISRDGKHLLVASKDMESTAFRNYKWEVFDLTTKRSIGALQSHVSYASFVVIGNHLLLERGPFETFDKDKVNKTPLQIALFDLRNGQEIWKRDILDTTYRGPSPP